MLGSPSRLRSRPFTYLGACETAFAVLSLVFIAAAEMIVIGTGFDSGLGPGPDMLVAAVCALLIAAVIHRALRIAMWQRLRPDLRARIPYDGREAAAGKGDIHSLGALWRALRRG